MLVADLIVLALGLYVLIGVLVALPFVVRGVNRIDPAAAGGSGGFRLLIFPGCVALWPWVISRWRRPAPAAERNAHRDAARVASSEGDER